MSQTYPVPAGSAEAEIIIKKSRFIARAVPVGGRETAMGELARARTDFPDARHHCFAYVIGKPGAATSAAMGDDGEPSGTAGKPILNVIHHKGIGDIMVIVIRYFGGTKLGAGGLVRAYTGVTEKVLAQLEIVEHAPESTCSIALDFAQEQPLRHWADQNGAHVDAVEYGSQVNVTLTVPDAAFEALRDFAGAAGLVISRD
ncbi:MAG: YigZ family protein [Alteromonadaceae bacterium]|nr:YigZ family protein [Alteromonadaceae bacterium]|tara:strand:+ start:1306 stop:1908 length:603 start_codon:yes stop_codon:yes gene_type:complete